MAVRVAQAMGAEIVTVDSMQVYRGMDIGTAKPDMVERGGVVHHMIDVTDPEDDFSVAEFRQLARTVLESDGGPVLITGGSGLHFRSLVDPLGFAPTDASLREELDGADIGDLVAEIVAADPGARDHLDLANPRRVVRAVEIFRLTGKTPSTRAVSAERRDVETYRSEFPFTALGIDPGELTDQRIAVRLANMRNGGLVEEVHGLRNRLGRTASGAVGYRELTRHFNGEIGLDDAFEMIERNTRKLAKKQRTWFQRDPRIRWIPWLETEDERVDRVLSELS